MKIGDFIISTIKILRIKEVIPPAGFEPATS
jgi:hypothetical protein